MQLCWVWDCYFWHVAAPLTDKYWHVWTCQSTLVLLCCQGKGDGHFDRNGVPDDTEQLTSRFWPKIYFLLLCT